MFAPLTSTSVSPLAPRAVITTLTGLWNDITRQGSEHGTYASFGPSHCHSQSCDSSPPNEREQTSSAARSGTGTRVRSTCSGMRGF